MKGPKVARRCATHMRFIYLVDRRGQPESTRSKLRPILQTAPSLRSNSSRASRLLETPPPPMPLEVLFHPDHELFVAKGPARVRATS